MPDGRLPDRHRGRPEERHPGLRPRPTPGDKATVRRHIKKRARALGKTDLIPESWASIDTPFDLWRVRSPT